MILLFLGSWRATLIIAITIPLAVLTSLLALAVLGQTINIMTLGASRSRSGSWWTTQPSPSRTSRIISSRRAARGGHSDRRGRDRGADLRVDAVDLHRVRADVPAHRRRALPVRAAGRSGDLRDDRVVLLLAHAGADARDGADAREGPAAARRVRPPRALPGRVRTSLRGRPAALSRAARRGSRAAPLRGRVPARLRRIDRPVRVRRQDFFPSVDTGEIRLHLRAPTGTRIERPHGSPTKWKRRSAA